MDVGYQNETLKASARVGSGLTRSGHRPRFNPGRTQVGDLEYPLAWGQFNRLNHDDARWSDGVHAIRGLRRSSWGRTFGRLRCSEDRQGRRAKRLVVESHIGPGEVRWRPNLAFPELREHQGSRGRVLARHGEARLRAMIVDLCLHAGH